MTSFYVDNYLESLETEEEAIDRAKGLRGLCWNLADSTSPSGCRLLETAEQLREFGLANPTVDLNFDELPTEKTLSVLWVSNFDAFLLQFKIDDEFKTTPTKSKFLGVIVKVFDPLGLVAPVVFVMKILMHEIWKLRVDWEEELPASVVERVPN